MTYQKLPANTPEILRAAGLRVVEVPGWRERGRPASTGNLNPVGVLVHHTATSRATSDKALVDLLVRGRSDLPGPLCHFGLMRDGTVHIIAAGRANHAGTAKASGTVAAGDGNALYWGVEAANDGRGEPWPKVQYDAYVILCAVLSTDVTGNSAQTVRGHKETSVTGKIDPTFDMGEFRNHVAAAMRPEPAAPRVTPAERRAGKGRSLADRLSPIIRDARSGKHRFPAIAKALGKTRASLRGKRDSKEGA